MAFCLRFSLGVAAAVSLAFATLCLSVLSAAAQDAEQCMYKSNDGVIRVTTSRSDVPAKYRSSMRCQKARPSMAAPDEVTLDGNVREETITTSLGTAKIRWPRSVETVFGRTPLRATVDAVNTVAKVVRSASFSTEVQKMDVPWNIVFLDENVQDGEIPQRLISNCHPGWMTRPANVYISAQAVAAGCGQRAARQEVTDKLLTEVLVHEFAHVVEAHMLGDQFQRDRMRAEGFATWFEQYAAQYSTFLNQREQQQQTAKVAKFAIEQSGESFQFAGSGFDYARASMYFAAIEDRFGLRGVTRLYERMARDKLGLFEAIQREFSWNKERLDKEVIRVVDRLVGE